MRRLGMESKLRIQDLQLNWTNKANPVLTSFIQTSGTLDQLDYHPIGTVSSSGLLHLKYFTIYNLDHFDIASKQTQ
jgi:hypothetical protein